MLLDATPAYHNPHLAVHDYDDCLHRNIKKNIEFVQIGSESQSVGNIQRLLIKACTATRLVTKSTLMANQIDVSVHLESERILDFHFV